eukprot:CAMPEP_0195285214 /NCGR_PEP_ID=MMETSP0707-20130614/3134_1 /TAXON_ID=33640 /ORGANISM="Asterionellopsis glacialis, Strain CCMP134" /LENGTH=285 /DNA_ID=CAMNT_0040344681 /DNA_START=62 /DNA_END=919 /DNA_ORIENTATION=-
MIKFRVTSSTRVRRYDLTLNTALQRNPRQYTSRRHISSLESSSDSSSLANLASELTNGSITRHGVGDGVIILNVGGKEFKTLRSTVASNQVLADHVARAEANHEYISGSTAVFVDRDPTHFGIILAHLRNKSDGTSMRDAWSEHSKIGNLYANNITNSKEVYVQLPRETEKLSDILLEAYHYRIKELADAACRENWMLYMARFFGSARNPFHTINSFITNVRRSFLALAGSGGFFVAAQQDYEGLWEIFKTKLGIKALEVVAKSGSSAGLEVQGKDEQLKVESDQ